MALSASAKSKIDKALGRTTGQSTQPAITSGVSATQKTPPVTITAGSPLSFTQRLKLSFGDEKGKEDYLKKLGYTVSKSSKGETLISKEGKTYRVDEKGFSVSDIADVAGGALPFLGSIIGTGAGVVGGLGVGSIPGAIAGGGVGAGVGETLKESIGKALGTREKVSPISIAKETAAGAAGALLAGQGGRVLTATVPKLAERLGIQTIVRTGEGKLAQVAPSLAGASGQKIISTGSEKALGRALSEATEGVIGGAAQGATTSALEGQKPSDIFKNALLGGAFGAGFGTLLSPVFGNRANLPELKVDIKSPEARMIKAEFARVDIPPTDAIIVANQLKKETGQNPTFKDILNSGRLSKEAQSSLKEYVANQSSALETKRLAQSIAKYKLRGETGINYINYPKLEAIIRGDVNNPRIRRKFNALVEEYTAKIRDEGGPDNFRVKVSDEGTNETWQDHINEYRKELRETYGVPPRAEGISAVKFDEVPVATLAMATDNFGGKGPRVEGFDDPNIVSGENLAQVFSESQVNELRRKSGTDTLGLTPVTSEQLEMAKQRIDLIEGVVDNVIAGQLDPSRSIQELRTFILETYGADGPIDIGMTTPELNSLVDLVLSFGKPGDLVSQDDIKNAVMDRVASRILRDVDVSTGEGAVLATEGWLPIEYIQDSPTLDQNVLRKINDLEFETGKEATLSDIKKALTPEELASLEDAQSRAAKALNRGDRYAIELTRELSERTPKLALPIPGSEASQTNYRHFSNYANWYKEVQAARARGDLRPSRAIEKYEKQFEQYVDDIFRVTNMEVKKGNKTVEHGLADFITARLAEYDGDLGDVIRQVSTDIRDMTSYPELIRFSESFPRKGPFRSPAGEQYQDVVNEAGEKMYKLDDGRIVPESQRPIGYRGPEGTLMKKRIPFKATDGNGNDITADYYKAQKALRDQKIKEGTFVDYANQPYPTHLESIVRRVMKLKNIPEPDPNKVGYSGAQRFSNWQREILPSLRKNKLDTEGLKEFLDALPVAEYTPEQQKLIDQARAVVGGDVVLGKPKRLVNKVRGVISWGNEGRKIQEKILIDQMKKAEKEEIDKLAKAVGAKKIKDIQSGKAVPGQWDYLGLNKTQQAQLQLLKKKRKAIEKAMSKTYGKPYHDTPDEFKFSVDAQNRYNLDDPASFRIFWRRYLSENTFSGPEHFLYSIKKSASQGDKTSKDLLNKLDESSIKQAYNSVKASNDRIANLVAAKQEELVARPLATTPETTSEVRLGFPGAKDEIRATLVEEPTVRTDTTRTPTGADEVPFSVEERLARVEEDAKFLSNLTGQEITPEQLRRQILESARVQAEEPTVVPKEEVVPKTDEEPTPRVEESEETVFEETPITDNKLKEDFDPDDIPPYTEEPEIKFEDMPFFKDDQSGWDNKFKEEHPILYWLSQIAAVPRTLLTMADASFALGQGMLTAFTNPKIWTRGLLRTLREGFTEEGSIRLKAELMNDPDWDILTSKDSRLFFRNEDSPLTQNEEFFAGNFLQKIPVLGRVIKASERGYHNFLDYIRFYSAKNMLENMKLGGDLKPEDISAATNLVNNMTGRGNFNPFSMKGKSESEVGQVGKQLANLVLFAPRYFASRLHILASPAIYARANPAVRKQSLKALFGLAGFTVTVNALAEAGGLKTESDPTSSDWGKIKIGNTRINPMGSFQPIVRTAARLIRGEYKNTKGKIVKLNDPKLYKGKTRLDEVVAFGRNKLSPMAGLVTDMWLTGTDFKGDKVKYEDALVNNITPIIIQDLIEIGKEDPNALWLATLPFFGVQTQTYK